jgi:hypothetical protein
MCDTCGERSTKSYEYAPGTGIYIMYADGKFGSEIREAKRKAENEERRQSILKKQEENLVSLKERLQQRKMQLRANWLATSPFYRSVIVARQSSANLLKSMGVGAGASPTEVARAARRASLTGQSPLMEERSRSVAALSELTHEVGFAPRAVVTSEAVSRPRVEEDEEPRPVTVSATTLSQASLAPPHAMPDRPVSRVSFADEEVKRVSRAEARELGYTPMQAAAGDVMTRAAKGWVACRPSKAEAARRRELKQWREARRRDVKDGLA